MSNCVQFRDGRLWFTDDTVQAQIAIALAEAERDALDRARDRTARERIKRRLVALGAGAVGFVLGCTSLAVLQHFLGGAS